MSQIDQRRNGRTYARSSNSKNKSTSSEAKRTADTRRTSARGGSSSSRSSRSGNNRKRRPSYDPTRILLGVILLLVAMICISLAVKYTGKQKAGTEEVVTEETQLEKEVMVDNISITGMSREQAKEVLLQEFSWNMRVSYNENVYEMKNLMEARIDSLLEEIFTGEPKENYKLDTSGLEEEIKAEVQTVSGMWDIPAQNGSISSFDKEQSKFIYTGEQNGKVLNQEKLISDIVIQMEQRNFQAVIPAEFTEVTPEITEAQAKEMYQVIGTYTTTTTANKDRNTNIRLASEALDGLILKPGEEFSFNRATGERSEARGYRPAGAYVNGVLVEEPGGGVCQVSSTLYNAVVFSGLTTTERHAHSYEPSYVTPGEDAMVSYGGPDMKFVNRSSSAIAIRSNFSESDRKLKVSIVGIPILEEGTKIYMKSKKTAELDPPAPVYEEDQTLEAGVEKTVKEAVKGSRWVTNLVTEKNGTIISDEFFHNSGYRGKPATIKRNTSGVVIPSQTQSSAAETTPAGTTAVSPETSSSTGTTAPSQSHAPTTAAPTTEGNYGPGGSSEAPKQTTAAPVPTTENQGPVSTAPSMIIPSPMS